MAIISDSGGTFITGERDIHLAQLIAQRGAVRLEKLGMRHSGGSVTARIKKHYNLKGNHDKVIAFLTAEIERIAQERKETGQNVD